MVVSLLSTKLYIPTAKATLINRLRLTNKLLAGASSPGTLMLISGPAGFGKTTLLIEFIQQYKHPVAWVSLDSADNDPNRFWTYFIKACQSILPGVGESALELFRIPQPLPDESIPTILINEIAGQDRNIVLILDDYHVIQNQAIHSALSFLLSHIPEHLHIILSTRVDPPWPVARFRSQGQLVEIRASDLRFTEEETANFLSSTMGVTLSAKEVASLESRTEGWIAGLQMAAISLRGRDDIDGFIKAFTGSHVFVAEYLVEEVLQQQTTQIQTFLLQTSILDRLTAGLCEAVTGQNDGQTILNELQRENLFILPLDDEGRWYRFHHLFADLLQARLKQTFSQKEIQNLHDNAANWFEMEENPEEAIGHAQIASDFDLIERVVTKIGLQTILQGYVKTVENWLRLFPQEMIEKSVKINLIWTWLYLTRGLNDKVSPFFERLEKLFAGLEYSNDDPSLIGEWLAIQAKFLNSQGKPTESRELSIRALENLPKTDSYVRSMVYLELATAYERSLDYEHAAEIFETIAQNAQATGDFVVEILGISAQARMMLTLGKLHRAHEVASKGIERLENSGKVTPFSATLFGEIGSVLFEWNQLDLAKEYFQRSTESSGRNGYSDPQIYQHVALSRMSLMNGDLEAASSEMQTVNELARVIHPVMTQEGVICQQIRVEIAGDHLGTAQILLEQQGFVFEGEMKFPGLASGLPMTYPAGLLCNSALSFLLAKIASTNENAKKILEMASLVLETAHRCQLVSVAIDTLLVRSQLYTALNDDELALTDVVKALELAEPEGYISIFVEEGWQIHQLLTTLVNRKEYRKVQPEFIYKILDAFPKKFAAPKLNTQSLAAPAKGSDLLSQEEKWGESLTDRELEVLALIAAGDSNQTIAEKLFISLSAVKKHTGNIYRKLSVNSRTQAVLRARQLELFIPEK